MHSRPDRPPRSNRCRIPARSRGLARCCLATLSLAVAATLPLSCRRVLVAPGSNPDSVLILDVDTLRADGLDCYGNQRSTSPAIDRFAAGGIRFAWTLAQAPNTPPSQASILTGLYPRRHGRIGNFDKIRPNVRTLAETLRGAGFRTAAFVDGGLMSAGTGIERGFTTFENLHGGGMAASTPRALDWLSRVGNARFFLLVHTYDVHAPYAPPEPFRSRFEALAPKPSPGFVPSVELLEKLRVAHHAGKPLGLTPNDVAYMRALYDGEVAFVDSKFADILAALSRFGLDRRTIVVVISDHGEEFLEHDLVMHDTLYTTVLRVPLILRVPGRPAGRVVDDLVQTVDLVPTLDQLLRVSGPADLDGHSLVPLIDGRDHRSEVAYSGSPFFGGERSLAVGDWRLFYRKGRRRSELYRYREDPTEQDDLAANHPEVVTRLQRALVPLDDRLAAAWAGGSRSTAQPSAETLRQLRALGYLH